jgi:sortase (surface protein transpeptidase)
VKRKLLLPAVAVLAIALVIGGALVVTQFTGRLSPAVVGVHGSDGSPGQSTSSSSWSSSSVLAVTAPAPPPLRLQIPKLQVDALVEAVGIDGEGRMATPSQPDHVAWFMPSAAPGDAGTAVMAGHLDWTTGPAVFWHLSSLQPGDEIRVVRPNGSRVRFLVDSIKQYAFDSDPPELFAHTGAPGVALVTCAGAWDLQRHTYLQRLAVHATLAPTAPITTPGDEGG